MVSTKGRYALRIMIDLAQNMDGGYITLHDIAGRQQISEKYLEIIISSLVKAGFVTALRGKGGGYKLTRAPEEYTVASVLRLSEGSLAPVACLENSPVACERADSCMTLPMWRELDSIIDGYLSSVTIADLLAGGGKKA